MKVLALAGHDSRRRCGYFAEYCLDDASAALANRDDPDSPHLDGERSDVELAAVLVVGPFQQGARPSLEDNRRDLIGGAYRIDRELGWGLRPHVGHAKDPRR